MTKQSRIIGAFLLVSLSTTAIAEVKWDLGIMAAYAAGGITVTAIGIGLAPIVVAGTVAVGLHAVALALYWDNEQSPPSTNGTAAPKALSIVLDPNQPLVTPTDWTPPSSGQQEATPPEEGKKIFNAKFENITYTNQDMAALASQYIPAVQASYSQRFPLNNPVVTLASSGPNSFSYTVTTSNAGSFTSPVYPTVSCGPGYTVVDEAWCALTEPESVQKPADGLCELVKTNGIFKPGRNDPDCQSTNVTGINTNTITANTPNNKSVITATADGRVTATNSSYDPATNKTTNSNGTFSNTNQLTSINTTQNQGDTTSATPGTGTGTGGTGGDVNVINFPNDYSRAGEANTAAQKIVDKLDPLTSLTGAQDGSETTPEFGDGFAGTFTPLTAWQLPSHTSTCPTAEFDVWSHNFQLNSQCTVFNQVKTPLSYAMVAAWVIAALFIVLGA